MSIVEGFDLLGQLDTQSFVLLFWYTVLLEFPRYGIAAVIAAVISVARRDWVPRKEQPGALPDDQRSDPMPQRGRRLAPKRAVGPRPSGIG